MIERVGVVGGGIMGGGIAEVCCRAGLDTVLCEIDEDTAKRAHERIGKSLARAVSRGKLGQAEADAALERVHPTADLGALADRQVVCEAVTEDKDIKLDVFKRLGEIIEDPEALLSSNTSSIPIVELGGAVGGRADHAVGIHFFNPVPVLSLVEIVPSLLTAPDTVERAKAFVTERLGKDPILCTDRAGFTVNALLIPYLLAAIRMAEDGVASAEDIDNGMVKGCAHPMGPLALSDLIGLDTVMRIADTLYEEYREQLYAPPPLLHRMVSAGMLGRKTGRGFYHYQ